MRNCKHRNQMRREREKWKELNEKECKTPRKTPEPEA
jgi:hypothetical protein